ncbi:hypothetical protein [Bradyrhizobium liaoningense]
MRRECLLGTERISTIHGFDHRDRAGITLARELWLQGRPADALQLAQQTVTEAAQMEHPITLCIALIWAVSISLWDGDLDGAEARIDQFIVHAESRSMGPYLAVGRGVKGELAIRRGDAAHGVETIRACLRELHEAGYELLTTTFNIALDQGLLALGQFEQSARLVDDAIRLVERSGDHLYMPELLRMKGKVLLSLPQPGSCAPRSILPDYLPNAGDATKRSDRSNRPSRALPRARKRRISERPTCF